MTRPAGPPVSRRTLLAATAALPMACTATRTHRSAAPRTVPDWDGAARTAARARELDLLAACGAALTQAGLPPEQHRALAAVVAEHREHLTALGAGPSSSAGPSPRVAGGPPAPGLPGVRELEARAADAHAAAAASPVSPALAALLAQLAASEASHVVALR